MYKRTIKILLMAWATLLSLTSCISGGDEDYQAPPMMEKGTEAPDFTISTAGEGEAYTLSSLRGKYVFLEFWASWCPDCQSVTSRVTYLFDTYASDNLVFLGVSFDHTQEELQTYATEHGMDWPHQWEPLGMKGSSIAQAYNVQWIPTFYLIDPSGKIVKGSVEVGEMETLLHDMAEDF